jgi:hypothetical protein
MIYTTNTPFLGTSPTVFAQLNYEFVVSWGLEPKSPRKGSLEREGSLTTSGYASLRLWGLVPRT